MSFAAACSSPGGSNGSAASGAAGAGGSDGSDGTAQGATGDGTGSGTSDGSAGDGSGGDGSATASVTTRTITAFQGGSFLSANYDPVTGLFTANIGGTGVQLSRFQTADYGSMLAMRDAMGVHNAYFAEGSGTQVVAYSGGLAGQVTQVAGFARSADTELPLTGSASFSGQYAGFTPTRRVNGDVSLAVDFAGATVAGSISNRVFRQRPDNAFDATNPLSTLVLEQAALRPDGTFAGATGGGQIVNGQQLWNPATGTFAGLIGGATGTEAVGTVTLQHNAPSGARIEEIGGFFAR
ncbi:MAG: hypothetical protein AAF891_04475 [Pseudomonadota bacterium]